MIEINEIQIDAKDLNKGSIVADYNESCVMDWSCFDNQADMEYIKECAESVGMDVTDKTAFTIPFIAEVMRKMRKQILKPYLEKLYEYIINHKWRDSNDDFMAGVAAVSNIIYDIIEIMGKEQE